MTHAQYPSAWTDADFEAMSWHDCIVHGLNLFNPDDGFDYEFMIDLDYILAWFVTPAGAVEFDIAPARLIFTNVDKLHIDVRRNYKESLAIDHIERQEIFADAHPRSGHRVFQWTITFHSYSGKDSIITFQAASFKQILTKPPIHTDQQCLDDDCGPRSHS